MAKLTKQQFNNIVAILREDIANYIVLTKQAFTNSEGAVEALQYDDIVYVNNALVNFMLDKDLQKLHNALLWQDTFAREHFLSIMDYCEEESISLY